MISQLASILLLTEESDIAVLTNSVRTICIDNRYDRVDTEKLVLACSEIGHNAVRHGGGGTAHIHALKEGKLMRIVIADNGNGIANIDLALREGYTTVKTSLGLGLEGAQRLVDNFDIKSTVGVGTTVTLEKYRPLSQQTVDYGLVSIPDDKYNYNGDQYVLKEYDGDCVLIGVIDGPGQGYDAFSIAQSCKQFVESNYRKPLPELLAALNSLMKESNDEVGITCSLARIEPHKVTYIGLGDSHAYLSLEGGDFAALTNQQGRVGYVKAVKNRVYIASFETNAALILCTDGIKTMPVVGLSQNDGAQQMANQFFDQYHRLHGDATIFTAKYTA